MKRNRTRPTPLMPVFLLPKDNGTVNIACEFASAKYSLTKNEMKAWYLFIASMDEYASEHSEITYTIDAVRFADKLNIDARKARGKIVADLFTRLSRSYIDLRSREDDDGEQNIYHANFISELYYNKKTHLLSLSIPPILNRYLFNLREGTYLSLDIGDILALDTVISMRTFIYLRNLERMGIHEISIAQFRQEIDLYPGSQYREFKRKVLKTTVHEIRTHTSHKDFFIEDDGCPGRKAIVLRFGFEAEVKSKPVIENVPPLLAQELSEKFSERILVLIQIAMDRGFDPRYIKANFDGLPDERIANNFHLVFERIAKDRRLGNEKEPETYGRYFIAAVKEDWATKDGRQDGEHFVMKQLPASENPETDIQEQEDMHSLTDFYLGKAKERISHMPLSELMAFIRGNKGQISSMAGRKGFNEERAMTRKRIYREFKILTQVVLGKMMAGEIKVPREQSLPLFR